MYPCRRYVTKEGVGGVERDRKGVGETRERGVE
jgi:hypothetical protein